MIKEINSFSKIKYPKSNTLVVLDIDETILSFNEIDNKWWNDTFSKLLPIYKENTYQQAELIWTEHVTKIKPQLLDSENFNKFFYQNINNCEIIFLTARNENISELTIKHLKDCNFDIHPSRIFYSRNKGEKLKEIVLNIFPDIQHILFVDDLEENLLNVLSTFNQSELSKYNLELYKIKHV